MRGRVALAEDCWFILFDVVSPSPCGVHPDGGKVGLINWWKKFRSVRVAAARDELKPILLDAKGVKEVSKRVEPSIKESAFSCPHCGAFSAHRWYAAFGDGISGEQKVPFIAPPDVLDRLAANKDFDAEAKTKLRRYFDRALLGEIFFDEEDSGHYLRNRIVNLHLSECFNCRGFAVWVHERLIFPAVTHSGIEPNEDLDADIRRDFIEARSIIDRSPRGSAALLRLALQKLCKQLGESGENIDQDIASLVGKGLNPLIQKALDVVRVVGNEAVHPGALDLRDDRDTALKLFGLINSIAQQMITHPKEVETLYGMLPESKRAGIDARNNKALGKGLK